jgi:membrane protease YdiL (CAAX protease family)
MMSKISEFQNRISKFQAEIILACSTTFIIAGLYCEKLMPLYLFRNPEIVYNYIPWAAGFKSGLFVKGIPDIMLPVLQGICSQITGDILLRILAVPVPQFIFFLMLPVASILLMNRYPSNYGMKPGNFRQGLLYSGICLVLMSPLLYLASGMPSFIKFYTSANTGGFWLVTIQYGIYLFCWEFLYRGYLYFSLEEKMGSFAIWVQSVPFAITHLGKPASEALTCYFGGLVLGWLAMKTRSFYYAFIIHWGIYVILSFFIFYRMGYFIK